MKDKKILILSTHIDDAEWGCGGFMSRMAKVAQVRQLVFSSAEQSTVEAGHTVAQLQEEHKAALNELGGKIVVAKCKTDYIVRHFTTHRQNILEDMVACRKEYEPDIVLLPGTGDCHQDHQVVHNEGIRAFRGSSILGYEIAHNYVNTTFQANMYIQVTDEEIEMKICALECFKTQAHRSAHTSPASIKALAMLRGSQIGVKYAEAYEVIRWIVK